MIPETIYPDSSIKPTIFYTKLVIPLLNKDYETASEAFDDECEWLMMSKMRKPKGKKSCIELCMQGFNVLDKPLEILFNTSTPDWGVFEYINRGVVTKDLNVLDMYDPDFKHAEDLTLHVGKEYFVAVCFVYHTNSLGKIYLVHEYFDLESLKNQLK